jgi:hypothetical protein
MADKAAPRRAASLPSFMVVSALFGVRGVLGESEEEYIGL